MGDVVPFGNARAIREAEAMEAAMDIWTRLPTSVQSTVGKLVDGDETFETLGAATLDELCQAGLAEPHGDWSHDGFDVKSWLETFA